MKYYDCLQNIHVALGCIGNHACTVHIRILQIKYKYFTTLYKVLDHNWILALLKGLRTILTNTLGQLYVIGHNKVTVPKINTGKTVPSKKKWAL